MTHRAVSFSQSDQIANIISHHLKHCIRTYQHTYLRNDLHLCTANYQQHVPDISRLKTQGHIKCWYFIIIIIIIIIIILHIHPEVLQHRWLNGSPQDESRTPRERRPVGGCRPNPILLDSLQVKHTRKMVSLNVIFFTCWLWLSS